MAQALKKEVTKPELDKNLATANSQKTEAANTPDASTLNFDPSKNFSRFLEASCDCC